MPKSDPFSTVAPIDDRIAETNRRLKIAQLGIQIERRGKKLSLRGTFPPRPGTHRLKPHQQRLSLNLPATPTGLKQAEQEAKIVAAKLIQNAFSWRDYLPLMDGKRLSQLEFSEKLAAFRTAFLEGEFASGVSKKASTKANWETAYAPYLRKLEAMVSATPHLTLSEAIYKTVESIPGHTRSRQICCTALGAFADYVNVDLPRDLKQYWGTYTATKTQARHLPSDEEIVTIFNTIPNPTWQFVYGIMATYGLRNHEVFFCDYTNLLSGDPEATVAVLETTKTGYHEVWPFHPDWVDQFNLRTIKLPAITTDLAKTTLQRIGQMVSVQFRRYKIPFSPYDLRHAWAVRTIHTGLPDTVAAQMMGHSVAIHTRTYHRWLTRRDQQQAVNRALQERTPNAKF
ncbi:MAG: site-specific integrase [Synechococcales cyanobacterium T60_A2020_003]|nr:site-specific integrase [Synechococcales cyanobacterium T60_A2020_003]